MTTLTQNQINTLKNKGLTDEKIQALAVANGLELPKQSVLSSVGNALIKSEKSFGQSIAGALGSVLPASWTGRKEVEQANIQNQLVTDNLLNKIKEYKTQGKDTTKLREALLTLQKDINFFDILNESTGGSLDKSAKQIFGEGFGVATDILGAGVLAGKAGQVAKATTFGQGFIQGTKTGVTSGAIVGAAQGSTRAMQENKSLGGIVGQGLGGGLVGGITGGIAGGVLGGVSGARIGRATKIANKESDFLLDLVSPKATEKVKLQALKEGRVTEQGLLTASKITPSKRDVKLAEAVKDVVSSKKTPIQNIDALDSKVSEINTGVKAYVAKNKVPFNTNQLETQLNKGRDELKLIFASDKTAERTYDAVVKEFLTHLKSKDTSGLLDARQIVDKIPAIKKLLSSQGLGENTKKEVVLTVREMANRYIANLLPKGNKYRDSLLKESRMIETIMNIAEKNSGMIGKNKLQSLTLRYPILKWLIGGVATGIAGTAGVGVGSAIIGSSD